MLIIKHHKDGRYFQIAAGIDSINVLDTIEEEEVCQMNNFKNTDGALRCYILHHKMVTKELVRLLFIDIRDGKYKIYFKHMRTRV